MSAGEDAVDERGHGSVSGDILARKRGGVRRGGVLHDPDDLAFRKDLAVLKREQERLADGEGGGSGNVVRRGHGRGLFLRARNCRST
jgi:hypothetical protein